MAGDLHVHNGAIELQTVVPQDICLGSDSCEGMGPPATEQ